MEFWEMEREQSGCMPNIAETECEYFNECHKCWEHYQLFPCQLRVRLQAH